MKNKHQIILISFVLLAALFRFWNLGDNPPSLYWDEASLGYNAYSILRTGRDEHGERFPIARFIAFGDYKPPGYIYASVPFLAIFGLNEFSIRFASALAGVFSVLLTYFLVQELFSELTKGIQQSLALTSALILAISPWHIHLSRGAFEANLATFFSLTGLYFFLKGLKRGKNFLFSVLFLVFSMYTFNTHRIFVPLLMLSLPLIYFKELLNKKRWILIAGIIGILLLLPQLPFLLTREGQLRFEEVTIFKDHDPILRANERIAREKIGYLANIFHNRRIQFAYEFLRHYFDNFNLSFLFIQGDVNSRLGTRDNGLLYFIELPLLLLGLYFLLVKRHKSQMKLLILWMVIGIVPAATARETPHALRILNILPVPQIIITIGLIYSYLSVKKKRIFLSFIIIVYAFMIISYLHIYHIHYPKRWAGSWQYGYKQMVEFISEIEDNYDKVFITRKYGRPYIFSLLYKQYSPEQYWQTRKTQRDWYGFWTVEGFDKYKFGDFPQLDTRKVEKWLLVAGSNGLPAEANLLKKIHFPNGEIVFEIGEIK